jgi:hypothetical protein
MNSSSLKSVLTTVIVAVVLTAPAAFAQSTTPDSFNGTFTDNFSEMTSTQTTAPAGWEAVDMTGSHYTFVPAGDYNGTGTQTTSTVPNFAVTSGTTPTNTLVLEGTLIAATGSQTITSDNTGSSSVKGIQGINYNNSAEGSYTPAAGEGARSLGTSDSGNAATILELNLTNTTGQAINAVNISYDIDRYTVTQNNNSVPSQYPNYALEAYPGFELFYNLTAMTKGANSAGDSPDGWNPNDWVAVSSLNPTINAGTTGSVNVPNTVGVTQVGTAADPNLVTLDQAWSAGATIGFAWMAVNSAGPSPDQNIGLNDVVIAAVPEPNSGILGLVAVGAALALLRLRRQRAA